jgi:hypothetical protein
LPFRFRCLFLMLVPLALSAVPARAQIERHELPPLSGVDAAAPEPGGAVGQPVPGMQPIAPAAPDANPFANGSGLAQPSSPLPGDLWRGLQNETLQKLLAAAPLPSPSPVLAALIGRALAARVEGGGTGIRVDALERAGRVEDAVTLLGGAAQAGEPGAAARYAVALFAVGRDEEACEVSLDPTTPAAKTDSEAKRAIFLVPAICAGAKDDKQGAALALQLARDAGIEAPLAFAAIDRFTKTSTKSPPVPKSVDVLDYIFLTLGGSALGPELAAKATPALLFRLARDPNAPPQLRLAAAERAAALNIIDGATLAGAYREAAPKLGNAQSAGALRARLFAALEAAPSIKIRGQSIDALLASGRDAGIEIPLGQALAQASAGLALDPQAAGFAETGVRVAALAGDEQSAWAWVDAGGAPLRSWQLLLAASDPLGPRAGEALATGVEIATSGVLPAPLLHRLVTVLDALDYDVPMPLWDAAGKVPQPNDGYLPATGELSALKEAADAGDVGRTVLLVAAALGPKGPAGANLIALGDAVRALKRVGLDQEARRVGFEALYAHWTTRGKA